MYKRQEQKELIEKLFQEKLVKVALATETLSAGINMPARSTVITSLIKPVSRKVNEDGKRRLEPNEFHQMAGRAGRRGIDKRGYTYCMAVNNAQEKGFKKLIGEKANDIESHLNTDFSFVANVDKSFNSDEFLTNFYQKSLFAYDKDPKQKDLKTKALVEDFKVKEKILKDNAFITSSNKVTEKGELLAKLNGYEQIPVIDAIYNQDMKGMNPQQLAGYVAGLAMLSTEEQKGKGDSFVPYDDEYLAQKATNLLDRVDEYNEDVYPKLGQGQELHLNTDAMKHVFKWADLNSENEDSTENWHNMFKGDTGFKFKDEGSLFKEITMTTDLLKQINEIAEYAKEQTVNAPDKRYYSKLQETTTDAIDLINKLSALARSMPSISITEAPRRSSNFAVSSFSLKERENAFERANCFMVTSQTRTSFIFSPCSCLYMFIWFLHFWVVRSRFRVSRFTLRAHQAFAVCAVLRFSLLRSSCSSFCDTSVRA